MFVSAKIHNAVREELAVERGRREELQRRVEADAITLRWIQTRVNQLEKERAILFREVTHLPIPVPEIVTAPIKTSADQVLESLAGGSLFDDMGDAAAKKAGVKWDESGAVVYADSR